MNNSVVSSGISSYSQKPATQVPAQSHLLSGRYSLGQNFSTGLAMLKDRVIKPLLVATEKVVEYYFPEDPSDGSQK